MVRRDAGLYEHPLGESGYGLTSSARKRGQEPIAECPKGAPHYCFLTPCFQAPTALHARRPDASIGQTSTTLPFSCTMISR